MISKKKILYVCQQVEPYLPATQQSLYCRNLIHAMHERGGEIRTFMPKYGVINERRNQLHEVIRLSGMNLIIDDMDHQLIIKVASIPSARIQIYFIDNDDYFARKAILGDDEVAEFDDNDERAIFFARGVLETVKKLRWQPDIVQCNGWFSGFVASYLRHSFADDPIFSGVKIVVSLDEERFDAPLNSSLLSKIEGEGMDSDAAKLLAEPTYENFCRFVISYADGVVISSSNVEQSIIDIARESGKPLLEYEEQSADYYDKYAKFYGTL